MEVEKVIGNRNEDATEGGRIDMAIAVGSWLLVIENKIYAQDQDRQLLRYANYAKSSRKDCNRIISWLDQKIDEIVSEVEAKGIMTKEL